MRDEEKTKAQLIEELRDLRELVAALRTGSDTKVLASGGSRQSAAPWSETHVPDGATRRLGSPTANGDALSDLLDQLQFARTMTDSLDEGLFVLDPAGRILYQNQTAESMLGAQGDDPHWQRLHPRIHPNCDALHGGECDFLSVVRTHVEQRGESELFSQRVGATVPIRYLATPIEQDGAVLGVLLLISDLSEQQRISRRLAKNQSALRRAETAVEHERRQAAELQTMIESIPDALLVVDTEARIIRTNANGASMYGLDAAEGELDIDELGEAVSLSLPDDTPVPSGESPLAQALRGITQTDAHLKLRRADTGESAHVLMSVSPIRDESGAITGALSVSRDVTNIYRLERQKDEFLTVASHELKTPLTSLKILAQLTRRRLTKANVPEASQLAGMERSIDRMERLVNDLLDVSRIQDGRLALRVERSDIVPLCEQVIEEQEAASGRHIRATLPVQPLYVHADPERVSQVLSNLVANALKYSPAFTPVMLEVQKWSDWAIISVSDRGGGIPEDVQERLFDRFYRVPGVQVQVGSGVGLGLGLYISREIVERHGGHIWAESDVGAGSTFAFRLPLAPPE